MRAAPERWLVRVGRCCPPQEFCHLARHLQPAGRASLFNRLIELGIFEAMTRIMLHSSDDVKLKASDVLMSALQHDVSALRTFLYQQADNTLFSLLINELTDGTGDSGLAEQVRCGGVGWGGQTRCGTHTEQWGSTGQALC